MPWGADASRRDAVALDEKEGSGIVEKPTKEIGQCH